MKENKKSLASVIKKIYIQIFIYRMLITRKSFERSPGKTERLAA